MAQDIFPLQKRGMRPCICPQLGQTSILMCRLYQPAEQVGMPPAYGIPHSFNSHRNPPASTPVCMSLLSTQVDILCSSAIHTSHKHRWANSNKDSQLDQRPRQPLETQAGCPPIASLDPFSNPQHRWRCPVQTKDTLAVRSQCRPLAHRPPLLS